MIDLSIFLNPDPDPKGYPCLVTSGVPRKDGNGVKTLSYNLEFIKKSEFNKYEPLSKTKAMIPMVKKKK